MVEDKQLDISKCPCNLCAGARLMVSTAIIAFDTKKAEERVLDFPEEQRKFLKSLRREGLKSYNGLSRQAYDKDWLELTEEQKLQVARNVMGQEGPIREALIQQVQENKARMAIWN